MVTSEPISPDSASFGARAVALALDFALLAVMHFFLSLFMAGWLMNEHVAIDLPAIFAMSASYMLVLAVSFFFLHLVYFTLFHAWTGQTIGKMILGIKVVTRDNKIIAPSVAFLRWTGYLLSSVPLAAGFLWAAVNKDHCAWHDRLAQTMVVSAEMT